MPAEATKNRDLKLSPAYLQSVFLFPLACMQTANSNFNLRRAGHHDETMFLNILPGRARARAVSRSPTQSLDADLRQT